MYVITQQTFTLAWRRWCISSFKKTAKFEAPNIFSTLDEMLVHWLKAAFTTYTDLLNNQKNDIKIKLSNISRMMKNVLCNASKAET